MNKELSYIINHRLLGAVIPELRAVSYHEHMDRLTTYYFLYSLLTEDQFELLNLSSTEIWSDVSYENYYSYFIVIGNNPLVSPGNIAFAKYSDSLNKLIIEKKSILTLSDPNTVIEQYTSISHNLEKINFNQFIGFVYIPETDTYVPTNYGIIQSIVNGLTIVPCTSTNKNKYYYDIPLRQS